MRPTHRPAAVSMGRVAAGSSLAAIVPRDGAAPVGSESECVHSAFSQGISGSGSDGAGTTRSSQGREGDRPLRCHMDGDTTRGCAARAGPAAHTSRRWDRGQAVPISSGRKMFLRRPGPLLGPGHRLYVIYPYDCCMVMVPCMRGQARAVAGRGTGGARPLMQWANRRGARALRKEIERRGMPHRGMTYNIETRPRKSGATR